MGLKTAALALGVLLLGQTTNPPAIPPYVTVNTVAKWDNVTADVRGSAETIGRYELALSLPGADLRTGAPMLGNVLPAGDGSLGTPLTTLFSGLAPGLYQLWVRAVDQAGNVSAWSDPLTLGWDTNAPRAPTNLRIEIKVTVGG